LKLQKLCDHILNDKKPNITQNTLLSNKESYEIYSQLKELISNNFTINQSTFKLIKHLANLLDKLLFGSKYTIQRLILFEKTKVLLQEFLKSMKYELKNEANKLKEQKLLSNSVNIQNINSSEEREENGNNFEDSNSYNKANCNNVFLTHNVLSEINSDIISHNNSKK